MVSIKGSKENQILIGHNQECGEKESYRKGRGEASQDKGSQNAQANVTQACPYRTNDEGRRAAVGLQIDHCCERKTKKQKRRVCEMSGVLLLV